MTDFLQDVDIQPQDYMVQQPRRPSSFGPSLSLKGMSVETLKLSTDYNIQLIKLTSYIL
jgi:hypothetical protein